MDTAASDILDKDILDLLGLSHLDDDKKAEFYEIMLETLRNRVMARILDALNDQDRSEFQHLLEAGDQEKSEAYLRERSIDIAVLMAEEAILYKTEIITLAQPILAKQSQALAG